ncbi:uncharacterized protein LOC121695546 [Alosa sapidissima]|uniref:uncharacterized protein LOC121695546 n=1 Tax=Alosa sapidissima TaxID=34773 RepID=UPI001C086057|nr:uncharacterized protein LOC121695546 [Alosa sapidissima]
MHPLRVLSLSCMWSLTVAVMGQNLTQYPPAIKSRINETASLYCQVLGIVSFCYTVAWMKLHPHSDTMELCKNIQMHIDVERQSCRADILRATTEDSGTYYCAVVYKERLFIGNGTVVVVEGQDSPSVEIALTVRHRNDSLAVLTCVVTGVHPSQARVFWVLEDVSEERGQSESVWTNGSFPPSVFTRNQVVVSLPEFGSGEKHTCVVESRGMRLNRSLTLSDTQDICHTASVHRMLGIASALLLQMMMVAMAQHIRKILTGSSWSVRSMSHRTG